MDNLELQMGVLYANMEELTKSVHSMHQDLRAFFMNQGILPPSLKLPHDEQCYDALP